MSGIMTRNPVASSAAAMSGHSRFAQRVRRRYADLLALLPPGLPDRPAMQLLSDAL